MDLAAHLGMTVGQMLRAMTPRELALWRIKWSEDPWGERRADLRSAQICALLANINRDAKKSPTPFKIEDFVLYKPESEVVEETVVRPVIAPETTSWLYAMAEKTRLKRGN